MNKESLLNSICNTRIGNLRLYANMARFSREAVKPQPAPIHVLSCNASSNFVGKSYCANMLSGVKNLEDKVMELYNHT